MHWVRSAFAGVVVLLAAQPASASPTATMVRDLTPGAAGTHPADITPFADGVLFTTLSTVVGESLWRSDGTRRGTLELGHGIAPKEVTAAGTAQALFAAVDDAGDELWGTDGTPAGTTRLADIRPGTQSSFPRDLTAVGDTVFFTADDGAHGPELWKSDGTAAGTTLVKDVRPGPDYWSFIRELTPVGTALYFTADDGTTRSGIWTSDGTEAGTALVWSGDAAGCVPGELTAVAGSVFFTCGWALWKTDGTTTSRMAAVDQPLQLTAAGATLFFQGCTNARGCELWRSDGTPGGTRIVKDVAPGAAGSDPSALAAVGDTLLFAADDSIHGRALWRSDGSSARTRRIPGPRGVPITDITAVDSAAFLRAGNALWAAFPGPSAPSATRVRRFPDPLLGNLTAAGDRLFFSAGDATHGVELWRSG